LFLDKPGMVQATVSPRGGSLCKPNTVVKMTCNATGKPQPEYLWYVNNQLVQRNMEGSISIQLNKTGENTLTCVPNNTAGIGQHNQTVTFNVIGKTRLESRVENILFFLIRSQSLHVATIKKIIFGEIML